MNATFIRQHLPRTRERTFETARQSRWTQRSIIIGAHVSVKRDGPWLGTCGRRLGTARLLGNTPWSKSARGAYTLPVTFRWRPALRIFVDRTERSWVGIERPSAAQIPERGCCRLMRHSRPLDERRLASFPLRRLIQNTERNAYSPCPEAAVASTNGARPTPTTTRVCLP